MMLSRNTLLPSFLLCSVYFVVAFVSFPQARKLLEDNPEIKDGVFYSPLLFCVVSAASSTLEDCRTPAFLVNAAAASLFVSAFSTLVFVTLTTLLEYGKLSRFQWAQKGMVLGISLFLIFIYIQTAISSWALAEETRILVSATSKVLKESGEYERFGLEDVRSHGNGIYLWVSGACAIFAAAGVLIDTVNNIACRKPKSTPATPKLEVELSPSVGKQPDGEDSRSETNDFEGFDPKPVDYLRNASLPLP